MKDVKEYEVTIGIPLYNAEKYIEQSLQSALGQNFASIEFLIVDDCGTDSGIAIIEQIKQKHARGEDIRIVKHPANKGVGEARNTLLDEARGKYLFFLDSDDSIDPGCVKLLWEHAIRHGADLVTASFKQKWESGKEELHVCGARVIKGKEEAVRYAFQSKEFGIGAVWNRLFRLDWLRASGCRFKPLRKIEDALFLFELYPALSAPLVMLPDITYTYVIREGSLCQFNYRQQIPLDEINTYFYYHRYAKEVLYRYREASFIGLLTASTMVSAWNAAAVIIDKRKVISEKVPRQSMKEMLQYPFSLSCLRQFKKGKKVNYILYAAGKLPYPLCSSGILLYYKMLKTYRKLRKKISF